MGELEKALDTRMRSMEIEDKLIDQVMGFTSEEQKLKYDGFVKSQAAILR